MRKHVLWLDDYFYDSGELVGLSDASDVRSDSDLEIQSDFQQIQRRFQNTTFHPRTTLSGFVQQIIDHERLFRGMDPKNKGACKLDAIVVDIMIDQADQVPVPVLDDADESIRFTDRGVVDKWVSVKFSENGSDAGLIIVQHFIRKLKSLYETGIIFYTHRPVNEQVLSVMREIKNSKTIYGFEKFKGIDPLYNAFKEFGLS
jgi:hypothetical protein